MARNLSGSALLDKALARRRLTSKQKVSLCEHLLFEPDAPSPDGSDVRRAWSDVEISRLLGIPLDEVIIVRAKAVQRLVEAYRDSDNADHLIGTTLQHYQTNFALLDQSLRASESGSQSRLAHIKVRHQLVRDFVGDLQNLGLMPTVSTKSGQQEAFSPGQLIRVLNDLSNNHNIDFKALLSGDTPEKKSKQGDVDDDQSQTD